MKIEISTSYNDWHLAKIDFPGSTQAIALFIGTRRAEFGERKAKYNIGYLNASLATANKTAPCDATPQEILEYIAPNKVDNSLDDAIVLEAIEMMQNAIKIGEL